MTPLTGPTGTAGATVETLGRSTSLAHARVSIPGSPPHTVEARYDTTFGSARVVLDGQPFQKTRVWGMQKTIEVPLAGAPARKVSLRFYGVVSPRIDISLDGTHVATI